MKKIFSSWLLYIITLMQTLTSLHYRPHRGHCGINREQYCKLKRVSLESIKFYFSQKGMNIFKMCCFCISI